ncbi:hypothetical protein F5Y11DRAFT_345767 [Daldinia sp. FL1419]|nr:hypothetical protein F5Y11DRAFT_345767 [Daldinia sp. FL1419]
MDYLRENDPRFGDGSGNNECTKLDVQRGLLYEESLKIVKYQWINQNIWRREWDGSSGPTWTDRWAHEDPLPYGLSIDDLTVPNRLVRVDGRVLPQAEKHAILWWHEASRPNHQYLSQVRLEAERLGHLYTPEPYTAAHAAVRSRWVARKIWDDGWKLIPGRTWKHEEPLPEPEIGGVPWISPTLISRPSHTKETTKETEGQEASESDPDPALIEFFHGS